MQWKKYILTTLMGLTICTLSVKGADCSREESIRQKLAKAGDLKYLWPRLEKSFSPKSQELRLQCLKSATAKQFFENAPMIRQWVHEHPRATYNQEFMEILTPLFSKIFYKKERGHLLNKLLSSAENLKEKADGGDQQAQYLYGLFQLTNIIKDSDFLTAHTYLKNSRVPEGLAFCYLQLQGIPKIFEEGCSYLEERYSQETPPLPQYLEIAPDRNCQDLLCKARKKPDSQNVKKLVKQLFPYCEKTNHPRVCKELIKLWRRWNEMDEIETDRTYQEYDQKINDRFTLKNKAKSLIAIGFYKRAKPYLIRLLKVDMSCSPDSIVFSSLAAPSEKEAHLNRLLNPKNKKISCFALRSLAGIYLKEEKEKEARICAEAFLEATRLKEKKHARH